MNNRIWVIAANASQARIFTAGEKREELKEHEALVHPESRMHTGDLISDNQGQAEGLGGARYPIEPETSPKKSEFIHFAKEIARFLESKHHQGKIEKLYLAASPSFLGILRNQIKPPLLDLLKKEIDKDVTHLSPKEIRDYFPYVL